MIISSRPPVSRLRALVALFLAAALVACGDPPIATPDAGPLSDAGGRSDAASDDGGPALDREAPRVIESTPDDGSFDVARSTDVVIRFSEELPALGTVHVRAEGVDLADAESTLDGDTLTIAGADGWPAASEIEIRLETDFADAAGNTLERPFVTRFTTADDAAPSVTSSTPAEGTTDVVTRLGALRIRFSEPMDQGAGSVRLEGGPGTIDATASWASSEVTYGISGLTNDTTYRVVLEGFRDRTGNALDGAVMLGDGAIDFTTRGDDEPPQVVSSTPFEGQVDVSPSDLGGTIEVVFDEPMDTTVTSAPLRAGATTTNVTLTWSGDHTARVAVAGAVALDASHALDLRGLRDVEGNALAPAPYLVDGRLDFVTGIDAFVPYVVGSTPAEGATGVPSPLREVRIAFSEAMDESITEVVVTDSTGASEYVAATWAAGGTVLDVPLRAFVQGRTYRVDVRGLVDRSGTPVSDVHAYLGDGVLDFALARPTGASCDEPLLMEHIAPLTGGSAAGIPGFLLARAQRTRSNGSASCDSDGPADGLDAVIFYRKTTPALGDPSGTGRALRIRTFDVSNRANIEVFRGVCDPRDPGADAARVRCATYHDDWDMALDVPAGDYYVWVSTAAGSAFDVKLAIEEVGAIPDGQACESAYTESSAVYTAPATAADPHVWQIPASAGPSVDITDSNGPFEAISCMELHQDDVVLSYDKRAADSVLDVYVVPSSSGVAAEVIAGGCRPADPGATRAGCQSGIGTSGRRFTARGPSGPTSVWLGRNSSSQTMPAARVEIRELPPPTVPGSSCATAIPLTAGASVPITPNHAARYDGPTCFDVHANVTWYAFDTTQVLTEIAADGAGGVAVVRAATGAQVACSTNVSASVVRHFAPIGTRLCVAVETGAPISSLGFESIAYDGAGRTAPVALGIGHPSLVGTIYEGSGITGDYWLATTPTRFYTNLGTAGVIEAPRMGGTSIFRNDIDGRVIGYGAVTIGEQLFTLDTSSTTTRLFRLTDASGAWSPTTWDVGASAAYADATYSLAFDGTRLLGVDERARTDATRETNVYAWSPTVPGPPIVLGRVDRAVYDLTGLAADATWLYFAGNSSETTTASWALYRVRQSDLASGTPAVPQRLVGLSSSPGTAHSIKLDDIATPRYLYFRLAGDIHVVEGPAGATPRYLGMLLDGDSGDEAMAVDATTGAIFYFSTREDPEGGWYRLDR